jgi:hypothetical protein
MIRALVASLVVAGLVAGAADARAAGLGEACKADAECPLGSICGQANVCVALPQKKSIIPFYFAQPGEAGYRYVPPLLYFHDWDKHRSTRVQVPFFLHRNNKDEQRKTTVVPLLLSSLSSSPEGSEFRIWPLVWMAKWTDGGQAAMLPLYWWQRHHGKAVFVAPALLSGGKRDDAQDITEAVVGLLGYYRRHHDDTWRMMIPIYFDHQTAEQRTAVGPFMWFHQHAGYNAGVIFPLAGWRVDHHTGRSLVVTALAAYDRNDSTGVRTWLVYAPVLYHRSDRLRSVDVVPPLFVRWSTTDQSTSGVIAGPFVSESDTQGSTTALVPLYWRFHDRHKDATTHILFPIAGFHHHAGARGGFVGPIYGWSSANGWGGGLAPILLFGRSGPRRHVLLLPLFAHVSNGATGAQTTAVGPLFVRTTRDGGDGGLFPLVFAGRHGASRYGLVPGLFYHRGDADSSVDVVGPLYVARGAHRWAAGLAPLAFFGAGEGKQHQVILPPLFIHTADARAHSSRLLVGLFYHRRDGAETADVLFPLFYLRRAPAESFGLWLIGGHQRANGVSTTVVGPVIHRSNANTGARTTLLFPLVAVHDQPGWSVRVVFPVFWRIHDGDETDTALFPLYFRGRSPTRQWDAVFPLLLHLHTPAASTTVVGPLVVRSLAGGGHSGGLFPLFAWSRSPEGPGQSRGWFGMPAVYADHDDARGTAHAWSLLFFYARNPQGSFSGLIPLVWAWRKDTVSHAVAPFFYRIHDSARDSSFNWLLLAWYGHDGKAQKVGLFPLFFASTHGDGTYTSGVFPLFFGRKRTDGSTVATLLFGWITTGSGKRFWVGPVYYRHDNDVTGGGFLPLVYHQRNHATGARTSLVIPLWLDHRSEDGHEVQAYTPLIWRGRDVESSTVIGLPLYFDLNRFGESRTTGFLPLFVRHRDHVEKTSLWILPPILSWWHKTPDHTSAGFFPLVWHFGGADRTTIVAPFVWDFRRGESRTTVFFPLGAHWRRPDADHLLLPLVYYRKGLGSRAGSWYLNVFPLITLGRPRPQDVEWYFLEGLFGYSRQGRNRNLRLLWVLDFKLEPVPASNLSWFGSTPTQARELF